MENVPTLHVPGMCSLFYIKRTAFEPRYGKAIGWHCSNCPRANVLWCAEHGSTLEAMCKKTRCGEQRHTARVVPCHAFSRSYLASLCLADAVAPKINSHPEVIIWSGCFGCGSSPCNTEANWARGDSVLWVNTHDPASSGFGNMVPQDTCEAFDCYILWLPCFAKGMCVAKARPSPQSSRIASHPTFLTFKRCTR